MLQFFPLNEDLGLRQPETRAIMTWLSDIQFTASATLHGVIFSDIFLLQPFTFYPVSNMPGL